jgi:signal transduction histidine kinase
MENRFLDSLEKALAEAEKGTAAHVDALNDLAPAVWATDVDRASDLIHEAHDLAVKIGHERGLAYARRGLAMLNFTRGDVETALELLVPAQKYMEEHDEPGGLADVHLAFAYIYWSFGDFRRGFDEGESALELAEKSGDAIRQGWALAALGGFYHDWSDHAKSLECYERAHALFLEAGNLSGQARCHNGIGNAHHLLGEHEKALECQERSLELHRRAPNPMGASKALNDIGLILQSMGRYDEALDYHQQSLEIREARRYLPGSATSMLDIANLYIVLRKYDQARDMLDRALVMCEKIKSKPKLRRAHELFSRLYRDLGEFEMAMVHFENFHRLTEEVFSEDFQQRLKNLRLANEIEARERDAEIERLKNVELREKNEQLEKTLRELHGAQAQLLQDGKMAALGNLTAGLVHEVNTPVGAIKSSADTTLRAIERLYNDLFPDGAGETDRHLRSIIDVLHMNARTTLSSAERIETISRSLKNFSRLDEAPFQRVDIHEGIDAALTLIEPEMNEKIEVVKQYGELPKVFVYPSELNQVFMNILLNAVQASADGGTLTIRTSPDEGRVHVEISDTGRGIPPDKLEHLFEPGFTRKYATIRMRTGLYTSYNIVRNHLGELTVDSTVGEGTTFRISIPGDLEKHIGGAAA